MDAVVVIGVALASGGWLLAAPAAVLAAAALSAAIAAWASRGPRLGARVVGLAAVVLALGAMRARGAVRAHERAIAAADAVVPRTARCSGVVRVESSPERVHGALRWSGVLEGAECDAAGRGGAGEAGGVAEVAEVHWEGAVTLYGGPADVARGDDVEVVAQIAPPNRLWNEGDPRPRLARYASVRSGGVVLGRVVRRGRGVLAWIDRVRARVRARIDATFPADANAMARALVLGESDLAPEDDEAMRASGLAHLLAVSGMHLVLAVVGVVRALERALARVAALAQRLDVGRVAAAIGVPLAWTYAELAGAGGSTRRAAWMVTIGFVARALGRRASASRSLGWSIALMAAGDALVAYDASFVLSAGATAGLLAFSEPIAGVMRRARWAPRALQPIARAASATLAATIPCAPLLAPFAPALPLGGVVANLLAVPLGESIALPVCLLHALLSGWPSAERGCALVATGALRGVRAIARGFAGIHALALPVPPPTPGQLAAIAVGFVAVLVARRGWRAAVLAGAAAAVLVLEARARHEGAPLGRLRVTFLDVGQGDAALVDLPDGTAILIDGGGLVGSPVDTGLRVVAPVLRARRRSALALAILTHPHPDHFTGLASGLAGVRVGALWDTGQGERESVGGAYATLLASMRARGVPVVRPSVFCGSHLLGGARLEVLAPCPDSSALRPPNDNSIAFRLSYGARAFLFVGDAERAEEADLLALARAAPARLDADVLKVGHHGSRTSSTPDFLAAVAPREAVVSAGPRNAFGHPAPETLAALAAVGARVWRTDRDGAVTVETDGTTLSVRAARAAVDSLPTSF